MSKIKLVVLDENTLAYIIPERPTQAYALRSSILKGSHHKDGDMISLGFCRSVRLAGAKDFDDYRVVFDGYRNNPHQYEFATT